MNMASSLSNFLKIREKTVDLSSSNEGDIFGRQLKHRVRRRNVRVVSSASVGLVLS